MEHDLNRLSVHPNQPEPNFITQAVDVLLSGGLLIFPTETVYGIAADANNKEACDRIYEAKGRDDQKPLALFAVDVATFETHGIRLPESAERIGNAYWPGPMTLVVPNGNSTVGLRIPDHAVPLAILKAYGGLLAVTSANRSGEPDATTAEAAISALGEAADLVLDAGNAPGGMPSSVIKIEQDGMFSMLREGPISEADVQRCLSSEK